MSGGAGLWDQLSEELLRSDLAVSRSTMMGLPCLRVDGAFFASLDKRNGNLIVKLAATEVATRVDTGAGTPFAPAGKVFREWLSIEPSDVEIWRAALAKALSYVRSSLQG